MKFECGPDVKISILQIHAGGNQKARQGGCQTGAGRAASTSQTTGLRDGAAYERNEDGEEGRAAR